MHRRTVLRSGGAVIGLGATAGCLGPFDLGSNTNRSPPVVEDPPAAVYTPSHAEGMQMVDTVRAGPYECALTYSFPHRFWLVTGTRRDRVSVRSEDAVHLMVSIWDAETGVVPPTGDVTLEISRNGERVVDKPPWPMLSQNMGFHFGDNVALPGEGTYDVQIGIGPMQTRHTGAFAGRFGDAERASVSFPFDRDALEEISFRRLDDTKGEPGALDPMQMTKLPLAILPPADQVPGTVLGEARSGDGRFVATVLEDPPEGVEGDGSYLAVSARTPYNRYPLAFMSVAASLARDGTALLDDTLTPTVDPALQYHYGAVVPEVRSGDTLALEVGAPPQLARHEGYETAFLEMDSMEIDVPRVPRRA